MEIMTTSFGGVLVKTNHGNFAINAGGSLEEIEHSYAPNGLLPKALILTTEHIHRFKNALEYSSKYGIPLIGDFIAFTSKKIKIQERWEVFLPRTIRLGTTSIHMFHIKYDSIAPFALTITDEEDSVGIIPDGKLTEEWQSAIQLLLSCNQIYFGNVRSQFPKSPESLSNRYRSTYNTYSEIEYLFRDYKGMRIFAEKENQL